MEEVIETLEELGSARVTEIAEEINRPPSIVHNHLATLQELEYVVKEGQKYKLGLRFLQRGEIARNRLPLYTEAQSVIEQLANSTRELVTLMVEEHGRGVYLDVVQGNEDIQYPGLPGTRIRLHCSAAGKAILAHLTDERIEQILDTHGLPPQTTNTITERDELFEELETIREQGYALDKQEFREGMRSIGAPICDEENTVIGGLSIAGPTHRISGERLETELPDELIQSVNVIELNYREPNIK